MLRTTITKLNKCPFMLIPRMLQSNLRYSPNLFDKYGVRSVIAQIAENSSGAGPKEPDSNCEKCQRIIDAIFHSENYPTGTKQTLDAKRNEEEQEYSQTFCNKCGSVMTANLADTTVYKATTGNDDRVKDNRNDQQKIEHIPNTTPDGVTISNDLTENIQPILEETPTNDDTLTESQIRMVENELQNKLEEIAKRCLQAPEHQIDEMIISEIDKLDMLKDPNPELQALAREFLNQKKYPRPSNIELDIESERQSIQTKKHIVSDEENLRFDDCKGTIQLQISIPEQGEDVNIGFKNNYERKSPDLKISSETSEGTLKVHCDIIDNKISSHKPLDVSVNCAKGGKDIIIEDGLPNDMKKYNVNTVNKQDLKEAGLKEHDSDENDLQENKIRRTLIENVWLVEKEMENEQLQEFLCEKTDVIVNSSTHNEKKKISPINNPNLTPKTETPKEETIEETFAVDHFTKLLVDETMPTHAFGYFFQPSDESHAPKSSDYNPEFPLHIADRVIDTAVANEQFDKHMLVELKMGPNYSIIESFPTPVIKKNTSDGIKPIKAGNPKSCNDYIEKSKILSSNVLLFKTKVDKISPAEMSPLADVTPEEDFEIRIKTKTKQKPHPKQNVETHSTAIDINKVETKISLQELLRRVRERSRLELEAQVVGKCDKDKAKPACPPPPPTCPPPPDPCKKPSPPCPPKDPCPTPCKSPCPTPKGPPCPPKKKSPCDKFKKTSCLIHMDKIFSTPFLLCWLSESNSHKKQSYQNCCRFGDIFNNNLKICKVLPMAKNDLTGLESVVNARDYEPWVPIPSWPVPKKLKKMKVKWPKDGCKLIPPPRLSDSCKENPCKGLPKRSP